MATIDITRSGKYRVRIRKKNFKLSKTFIRKKDALAWARITEIEIYNNTYQENRASLNSLGKILSLLRIIKLNEEQKFKFCKEAWKN